MTYNKSYVVSKDDLYTYGKEKYSEHRPYLMVKLNKANLGGAPIGSAYWGAQKFENVAWKCVWYPGMVNECKRTLKTM